MARAHLRAAVIQAEVAATLEEGLALTASLARDAKAHGASLIVFPETRVPGYPIWLDVCRDAALWNHPPVKAVFGRLAAEGVVVPSPAVDRLSEIARDAAATLVIGVSERVDDGPGQGTLYNSILTFGSDGRLLNHHRKLL